MFRKQLGLLCLVLFSLESYGRTLVLSGIAGSENAVISERVLREAYASLDMGIVVDPIRANVRSLCPARAG